MTRLIVKSMSCPHQRASVHCHYNRREVLLLPAYSPDLALSNFHLFCPLREALGGKRCRADDKVQLFCATMAGQATTDFS